MVFDVFLSTVFVKKWNSPLRSVIPTESKYSLLQTHPPVQSRTCNGPILPSKGITILDVPVHPVFRINKTKMYFVETGDFNLYVRPIPKCDVQRQSFTQSPSVKISFNCDIQSSHELGSLRCQIGASPDY